MTIQQALKKYHKVEIELLLAHVLRKSKEFLFMNPAHGLTREEQNRLTRMVQRRLKGEPMAYILGYKDFYGLRFKVNKDVLIPRPETEWLVENIEYQISNIESVLRQPQQKIKILDLGTGSGAIIISLAKTLIPKTQNLKPEFYASDISKKALKVSKQNAKRHKVKVQFLESDLFKKIKGKFDVIIANLPYVPLADYKKLYQGLKFEPKNVLTDGTERAEIYEKFLRQAPAHLSPGGVIYFEIDPSQRNVLGGWVKKYLPKGKIKFFKDLQGLWRFAKISA